MTQEFVSRRDVSRDARGQGGSRTGGMEASGRVITLYPGETIKMTIRIYGPEGHLITIEEQGFPNSIASLLVTPRQAVAPFNSIIRVSVAPNVAPGVYPWKLIIRDVVAGESLGEEVIVLVVMPRRLSKNLSRNIIKLIKIYKRYGIQVALWATLRTFYPNGARFSTIWALYQLITGRMTSKGTVGNTLKVMVQKGLLEKRRNLYVPLDLDKHTVLSRIDIKRVRYPWQVVKPKPDEERNETRSNLDRQHFSLAELPAPIRKAYMRAREIAEKHGPLTGLYFLLYSVFGVRQTGHLLLWLSGWFIVLEPKTGFAHHFYSWLLHWMLEGLGLRERIYYQPGSREHIEAQRKAQKYVRRFYGSHQNARRLHYMLWERGYTWSDGEVYTVKVYRYANGEVGIDVLDKTGREELYSEGLRGEPAIVEVYTALPLRHVDRRNEETYFHRPAGLL